MQLLFKDDEKRQRMEKIWIATLITKGTLGVRSILELAAEMNVFIVKAEFKYIQSPKSINVIEKIMRSKIRFELTVDDLLGLGKFLAAALDNEIIDEVEIIERWDFNNEEMRYKPGLNIFDWYDTHEDGRPIVNRIINDFANLDASLDKMGLMMGDLAL